MRYQEDKEVTKSADMVMSLLSTLTSGRQNELKAQIVPA